VLIHIKLLLIHVFFFSLIFFWVGKESGLILGRNVELRLIRVLTLSFLPLYLVMFLHFPGFIPRLPSFDPYLFDRIALGYLLLVASVLLVNQLTRTGKVDALGSLILVSNLVFSGYVLGLALPRLFFNIFTPALIVVLTTLSFRLAKKRGAGLASLPLIVWVVWSLG